MSKWNNRPWRWVMAGIFGALLLPVKMHSQVKAEGIYSKAVLYNERAKLKRFLEADVVERVFALPLDSTTEYRFEGACGAVTQYLLYNEFVRLGIEKMTAAYSALTYDTRRAFLEMLYALDDHRYEKTIRSIIEHEMQPKLFAMCAVYLHRADPSFTASASLLQLANKNFPDTVNQNEVMIALKTFLRRQYSLMQQPSPDMIELFAYQKQRGIKTIYSLQRWNRNYRGLAIVQREDGSFVRDSNGRLMIFEQLARSASDLPYFITNGSTPQGVYRVTGTAVSRSAIIGPTPNLQLIMPYEENWENYFCDSTLLLTDTTEAGILSTYLSNYPTGWRSNAAVEEVLTAGKTGRTEIIAHGTTIDPEYFAGKSFYPLTPTLGCLCAREQWNITTGKPSFSEQLNLVNAWLSSPARKGLLYVINLNDKEQPVSRAEVEAWVNAFEKQASY
ncbi:MAG: hypothetical protein ACTHLE_16290 [Agriterribacter sp.]